MAVQQAYRHGHGVAGDTTEPEAGKCAFKNGWLEVMEGGGDGGGRYGGGDGGEGDGGGGDGGELF